MELWRGTIVVAVVLPMVVWGSLLARSCGALPAECIHMAVYTPNALEHSSACMQNTSRSCMYNARAAELNVLDDDMRMCSLAKAAELGSMLHRHPPRLRLMWPQCGGRQAPAALTELLPE